MEKKRLLVLLVLLIVVVLIFFIGPKFTGKVVSEEAVECNVVDLDGNGIVDLSDYNNFSVLYDRNVGKEDYCGYLDLSENRKINILDSNKFAKIYKEYYEVSTGPCTMRELDCQEESLKPEPEQPESEHLEPEEKLSFFQKIINFFKNLFGR